MFYELSDSRTHGKYGHPNPIPLSEILSYCEMFNIRSLSERERLLKLVRAMDRAYVSVRSKQVDEQLKAQKSAN